MQMAMATKTCMWFQGERIPTGVNLLSGPPLPKYRRGTPGSFRGPASGQPGKRFLCDFAGDFDKDGDMDVIHWRKVSTQFSIPLPGTSQLLRNENGQFTNVIQEVAPGLDTLGMVTAALVVRL